VRLFDLRNGALILNVPSRGHDHVTASPDGRVLATWGEGTGVQLWDAETGTERLGQVGHRGEVVAIAFAPDGTRVVTGAADGTVRAWDTRTGAEECVLPVGSRIAGRALDGNGRVAVDAYQRVEVWRLADGSRAFASRPLDGSNTNEAIAFTRDGGAVEYHARYGNPVYRWHLAPNMTETLANDPTLARLRALSPDHLDALSADRTRAAIAEPGAVVLRELPSGKELLRLASGRLPVVSIAPDGEAFAVGEADGGITWITRDRRRELRPWKDAKVTALAFSRDGRMLACGAADGRAVLWRPGD
jgi:WD40 repeat protein